MITTHQFPIHTTASVTNADTYLPSAGGFINTKGAHGITLMIRRTAETGTCTLQAFPQWLDELANTFQDLLDENDATVVSSVVYADAAVDTTGYRLLILKNILPVGHTTGIKTFGTNHKSYQPPFIPEKLRFRFRHGGTAVTNTFGAMVQVHTAK